jgi:hypothetical protein
MNAALAVGVLLFLSGVALGLAQLWAEPFQPEMFVKLAITDAVALVVLAVGYFGAREKRANDEMRKRTGLR